MDQNLNLLEYMIDVPGGKVYSKIYEKEKSGIPILVVHGGPGGASDYLEPLNLLSSNRPVIFYDQLGCGLSDKPEDSNLWTLERYVEELIAIMQFYKFDKYHLLGQSWGTMLSTEFILTKKPTNIVSCIFSGPVFSSKIFLNDQKEYLKSFPEKIQNDIIDSELKGDFANPDYQNAIAEYYQKHVCKISPYPECFQRSLNKFGYNVYLYMWGPSEFTVTGTLQDFDKTKQLNELDIPILLICGRDDEASPKTVEYYNSLLPKSEFVVIENSSHMHHLEQPEIFNNVVNNFINKIERSVI